MKTLQNNFTTQEESKRLLELGVPADSCDSYYIAEDEAMPNWLPYKKGYSEWRKEAFGLSHGYTEIIPCWSVGRLIEIYELCTGYEWHNKNGNKVELLMADYQNHKHLFDFSRLDY